MLLCIPNSLNIYQWDMDRFLIVKKEGVKKVYFFHEGDEYAISVNINETTKKVKIPENILKVAKDIQVHLISEEGCIPAPTPAPTPVPTITPVPTPTPAPSEFRSNAFIIISIGSMWIV